MFSCFVFCFIFCFVFVFVCFVCVHQLNGYLIGAETCVRTWGRDRRAGKGDDCDDVVSLANVVVVVNGRVW
jgi:hypothetical protein